MHSILMLHHCVVVEVDLPHVHIHMYLLWAEVTWGGGSNRSPMAFFCAKSLSLPILKNPKYTTCKYTLTRLGYGGLATVMNGDSAHVVRNSNSIIYLYTI